MTEQGATECCGIVDYTSGCASIRDPLALCRHQFMGQTIAFAVEIDKVRTCGMLNAWPLGMPVATRSISTPTPSLSIII